MNKLILAGLVLFAPALALATAECPAPSTLGDSHVQTLGIPCWNYCEPTLQSILDSYGYGIAADRNQTGYKSWANGASGSRAMSFTATQLGKYSANQFVFGYFANGDTSTFIPLFKTANIAGYESVPYGSSGAVSASTQTTHDLEFVIFWYWGNSYIGRSSTVNTNSTNGEYFGLVYNAGTNRYVVAFEDYPGGDYDYNDLVVDIQFRCQATCTSSLSPTSVNQGSASTLSWTSQNADVDVYINNFGYVSSSGSASVSPSVTTDYSCIANGSGGSDGWHTASLTVHPSCTFNGSTVANGSSVVAYQASTVAYGTTCASQTRTCSDGILSGTYTYASCSVAAPANCTLDGVTVNHGSSHTFYSNQLPPTGQLCSSVSQTRTCTNGTLSGTDGYSYASCTCAPIYSCSGNSVVYTNASCATITVDACVAPAFCSPGVSACQFPAPAFETIGTYSGHLTAKPLVVPGGAWTKIFWNVANVSSCTVSGDNGDSWTGASSSIDGKKTSNITQRTIYTISCNGLDGSTVEEALTINVLPVFQQF